MVHEMWNRPALQTQGCTGVKLTKAYLDESYHIIIFLSIQRPPRSTLFPTRRSSDLRQVAPLVRAAARPDPRGSASPASSELLLDRKSTRLNSSHSQISYAVFCLKKKSSSHQDSTAYALFYHHDL